MSFYEIYRKMGAKDESFALKFGQQRFEMWQTFTQRNYKGVKPAIFPANFAHGTYFVRLPRGWTYFYSLTLLL